MKQKLKEFVKKQRKRIALLVVPIVLLFSNLPDITLFDRIKYFFRSAYLTAPFFFVYTLALTWYNNNELFANAIGTALVINLLVGIKYHWTRGTFSIRIFLIRNIEMLLIIASVYFVLMALAVPLSKSFTGTLFISTVEFISILYPTSKALKNIFIISNGKFPPTFIMRALYDFDKDGNLNDFVNKLSGKPTETEVKTEE